MMNYEWGIVGIGMGCKMTGEGELGIEGNNL
jgi:hypothetical protein